MSPLIRVTHSGCNDPGSAAHHFVGALRPGYEATINSSRSVPTLPSQTFRLNFRCPRPQLTRRAGAAAVAPVVAVRAVAEVAGVGLLEDQVEQRRSAEVLRQFEGRRLVDPHQRRVQNKAALHAEIERHLQRLDAVVAAVRIAGVVGLAHAGDDVADAAAMEQ